MLKRVPKRSQYVPICSKRSPKGSKRSPKEPKGTQKEPKGIQKEPKRVPKRPQKGTPRGSQNMFFKGSLYFWILMTVSSGITIFGIRYRPVERDREPSPPSDSLLYIHFSPRSNLHATPFALSALPVMLILGTCLSKEREARFLLGELINLV